MIKILGKPGSYFNQLSILCLALIVGVSMFCAIAVFLASQAGPLLGANTSDIVFIYVALILSIICLSIAIIVFNKKLKMLQVVEVFDDKLKQYRSAIIIRAALIEAPALLNIIFFMLTQNTIFLFLALSLILIKIYFFPRLSKISSDLALNYVELEKIQNEDTLTL